MQQVKYLFYQVKGTNKTLFWWTSSVFSHAWSNFRATSGGSIFVACPMSLGVTLIRLRFQAEARVIQRLLSPL